MVCIREPLHQYVPWVCNSCCDETAPRLKFNSKAFLKFLAVHICPHDSTLQQDRAAQPSGRYSTASLRSCALAFVRRPRSSPALHYRRLLPKMLGSRVFRRSSVPHPSSVLSTTDSSQCYRKHHNLKRRHVLGQGGAPLRLPHWRTLPEASAPHAIGHDGRLRRRMPIGHTEQTAHGSFFAADSRVPPALSDDSVRSYNNLYGTNERNGACNRARAH